MFFQTRIALFASCVAALSALPPHAWAQVPSVEDSLPLTDDPTDPIGIDRQELAPKTAATSSKPSRAGASPRDASFGPEPPALVSRAGEVLAGTQSVREQAHRTRVVLGPHGLAEVRVELEFENAGEKPAEVMYRLAAPSDAALTSLEVCNPNGCRSGLYDDGSKRWNAYDDALQARGPNLAKPLPLADARVVRDARGSALRVRAAPVSRSQWLRVRVAYVANAPLHGGVARLQLPGRGMDARAAPLSLEVQADGMTDLRANGLPLGTTPWTSDPWAAVELSARAGAARSQLWKFPCGQQTCARAYATAAIAPAAATEIYLAIDASPSTEGHTRSRLLVAVAALLARAPAGSHVRALRFASQALPLLAERKEPRDLALSVFGPIASEAELGAATRFESAWQAIEASNFKRAKGHKLIVILGDGGLTTGPAKPFDAAKRAGVEVAVLNVSNRRTERALASGAALTGGAVVDAGEEAEAALKGGDPERLEERVAALFQPARGVLRVPDARGPLPLRAGDSVSWEGRLSGGPGIQLSSAALPVAAPPREWLQGLASRADPALSRTNSLVAVDPADLLDRKPDRPAGQDAPAQRGAYCDRRGPATRRGGLSSDTQPVQLAHERAECAVPVPAKTSKKPEEDAEELGAGMPSSPLLSMLRQRIMPVARGCFRRDRAGRADYQVRAVFEFQLADREVVSAQIQGKIQEELRRCLLSAVDTLAVPRFTGKVLVRYPLVTEREPLPAQIELTADTAGRLDAVIEK